MLIIEVAVGVALAIVFWPIIVPLVGLLALAVGGAAAAAMFAVALAHPADGVGWVPPLLGLVAPFLVLFGFFREEEIRHPDMGDALVIAWAKTAGLTFCAVVVGVILIATTK